ncbi:MAG: polysaccharide deacetylase family protein, partial [Deltaproteobacteria bacterium]|nr:polysaccharide deacetylase family protein [Deltaproteobacteria bacterium]
EWASSGHLPDDLFETLRKANQSEKWRDLCTKLSRTPDPGLSLFENALTTAGDVAALECRTDLLMRIDSYQLTATQRLEDRFAARASGRSNRAVARSHRHPPLVLKRTTKFKLDSRVVKVDASTGPIFSPVFGVDRLVKHYGAVPFGGLAENEINFTFDDGPLPTRTDNVLAILESAGVRANFYQMGKNAFAFPELSQKAREQGHVVGSHSVYHPIMTNPARENALFEILCGAFFVGQAAGEFVPFFRFPGGAWTDETVKITRDNGLAVFFWDMDSNDWKEGATAETVFNQAMDDIEHQKKGIILMHDVHSHTAVALPYILEELAERKFTTVVFEPEAPSPTSAPMPPRCEARGKLLQADKRSERKHWGAKEF